MDTLRSAFAGITALICMLSAASCSTNCGFDDDNGMGKNSSQTADKVMDRSYSSVEIDTDIPLTYLQTLSPLGDTGKIFLCGAENTDKGYVPAMYVTDTEFLTFDELTYELPKGDNIESDYKAAVSDIGTIFLLSTIIDFGDTEMPDYDDPDFDHDKFDYEAMWENAEIKYKLASMDHDGTLLSETYIKGVEKYQDKGWTGSAINEIYPIGSDTVMIEVNSYSSPVYLLVDSEGDLSEPVDFGDDDYFYPTGTDINGNFVYVTYNSSGDDILRTLDASTLTLSQNEINLKDAGSDENYIDKIFKGSGDYTLFLSGRTSLIGLKADGTVEEIINWKDSDINGEYVNGVIPLEHGDYAIFENYGNTDSLRISRLTRRDPSELENIQIINIAVNLSDSYLDQAIQEFNKSNTEYRIRVDEYYKYYEMDEKSEKYINTPVKQLKQDIATGKKFDMIYMKDGSLITNLAKKGALVDMYEYMGTYGTVSREDIVEPVLKAGEVNGKLVSISEAFNVNTLACKTKYCDIENWTLDDVISTYNSMPDDMQLIFPNTKKSVFSAMEIYWESFVDYENGTCDFNDPEFIKLLEFCNQFSNEGEGDDINWKTSTNEEFQEYLRNQETANLNDKALLRAAYFYDERDYARIAQVYFGDDITLVGFPSTNGHGSKMYYGGSYSIMANSKHKDVCWNFISSLFDEERQFSENGDYSVNGFPALKTAFEKTLDSAMEKPYIKDENGKKIERDDSFMIGGNSIAIDPLTQEERDYFEQYLLNVDPKPVIYNKDLTEIVNEEIQVYFAGEKSAEETASIIQNRASILVSEQS